MYGSLCNFALSYVSDFDKAADLAQDCFLKLWELRNDFHSFQQAKAFLYTAVRNQSLNELAHLQVANKYATTIRERNSEEFFHDHLIEEEVYRLLFAAIETLPAQTKRVIQISLEGISNAEVAERMKISIETVRTLKKDGYKKIRLYMGRYYTLLPLIYPIFDKM